MSTRRIPRLAVAVLAIAIIVPTSVSAQPGSEHVRPRITGISHVALYFHEIASTETFYKDFLGYAEPYSQNGPAGDLSLTCIKINDFQQIALVPEKETGSDRLERVAFVTDDAIALRDYLAAKGVEVPGKVDKSPIGNLNFTVKDPDGHNIEMVQHLPDGWTLKSRGKDLPVTRIAPCIRHVGIIVGDLDAAMRFYHDILGFEEAWRGSSNERVLSWVNMKVPNGDDYIELMLYDPASPLSADRIRTMNHICFEVADIVATERTVRGRAIPVGCKAVSVLRTGVNGKRQMNCFDPDGTRIEIMERSTVDGRARPSSPAPPPGRRQDLVR